MSSALMLGSAGAQCEMVSAQLFTVHSDVEMAHFREVCVNASGAYDRVKVIPKGKRERERERESHSAVSRHMVYVRVYDMLKTSGYMLHLPTLCYNYSFFFTLDYPIGYKTGSPEVILAFEDNLLIPYPDLF